MYEKKITQENNQKKEHFKRLHRKGTRKKKPGQGLKKKKKRKKLKQEDQASVEKAQKSKAN